ncbi:MAG: FUSC family protein [Oscillospiraceae bacterium]|nr:FUSC family protein [Oscillospiraceae bacterium]
MSNRKKEGEKMEFHFGDFHSEVGSINPAALPPNKRRLLTIKRMLKNLLIVAYIVGFCTVYMLLFGQENILLGATIATCILTMRKAVLGIKAPQAVASILLCYLLIAFGPLLGGLNLFLALPINFGCMYLITLLTGQHVLQKAEYNFLAAYVFAESSPVTGNAFWIRLLALMIGGVLVAAVYYIFHRKEPGQHTLRQIFQHTHLTSTRNQFAIRLAGGLTLTMLIGDIFHLQYAAWMGMPVLSLSMPFVQDTQKRAIYRMIGTLVGGVVFLVLFGYVIPEFLQLWCLVALLYIYLFLKDYRAQQMVIAIFSLNSASVFYGTGVAIEMRILLLLIGVAIVFLMNLVDYLNLMNRLDIWLYRRKRRKMAANGPSAKPKTPIKK